MSLTELTSRAAVLAALHEFDERGRELFLSRYGFNHARSYFLEYEGSRYDSKAIAGVAHGIHIRIWGTSRGRLQRRRSHSQQGA